MFQMYRQVIYCINRFKLRFKFFKVFVSLFVCFSQIFLDNGFQSQTGLLNSFPVLLR